jgi:hypothetical protein
MDSGVQGGGKPGERFPQGLKPAILFGVCGTAKQAAEKLNSEGDGGFNPRVKPLESVVALATEGRFSHILPGIRGFSAACKAVPYQYWVIN